MPQTKWLSLFLIVVGLIVLAIAYQQSGSFGDQAKHAFTGDYRDRTTWLIVVGAIAAVLGFVGFLSTTRGTGS